MHTVYFLTKNEIDSYDDFIVEGLSNFAKIKNYKYFVEIINNAAFSHGFEALSEKELCKKNAAPLLSLIFSKEETPRYTLIGAVFFSSNRGKDKDIICKSKTPGWQQLNKPYLQDGKPICGNATTEFVVN